MSPFQGALHGRAPTPHCVVGAGVVSLNNDCRADFVLGKRAPRISALLRTKPRKVTRSSFCRPVPRATSPSLPSHRDTPCPACPYPMPPIRTPRSWTRAPFVLKDRAGAGTDPSFALHSAIHHPAWARGLCLINARRTRFLDQRPDFWISGSASGRRPGAQRSNVAKTRPR